jgi:hypothetical protein
MSFPVNLQALTQKTLLSAVSAANTAAATSSYIDVREYEGDIQIMINTGAITGSNTITFDTATDSGGTGSTGITPNEGAVAVINTANQIRECTINANATLGFLRIVGTIVTGPNLISATLQGHPKYT